ncbi:MAG: L,D-transpeptidase family protein [Bacteroidia bacterium]|nr:L,D-transpeptidase family protein [Bacteroidia bacterium]
MNTLPRLLIFLLLLPAALPQAQTLMRRLETRHDAYWTEAFGDSTWKRADIGFVIIKQTRMLHVVRQDGSGDTLASFPVCTMGFEPGFKAQQGDGMTPDGIYSIVHLNPASRYHLSMKINYPNAVDDKRHARYMRLTRQSWSQGGDIFIHGRCVSIGCVAMTDSLIEKLYLLAATRPAARKRIPVLILPFDNEARYQQMIFEAEEEFGSTGAASRLLLRAHYENMRNVLLRSRATERIPSYTATADGLYNIRPLQE